MRKLGSSLQRHACLPRRGKLHSVNLLARPYGTPCPRASLKARLQETTSLLGKEGGYTLIELALVILLISISLSIFAPQIFGLVSSYRRDSAIQKIGTFLNYHQGEVEISGRARRFCLDLEKGEYWAEINERGNFSESTEILGKRVILPKNISFLDLVTAEGKFSEGLGTFPLSSFFINPVIIHFKEMNREQYYSLYWKPLSGKTEVYDGYIEETTGSG